MLVDVGNDRAWEEASLQALLAGPADGLLLFEVELPPGAAEHAIQIEMCPGTLPVVRLDVDAGVDHALDHPRARAHAHRRSSSSFDCDVGLRLASWPPAFDEPPRPTPRSRSTGPR